MYKIMKTCISLGSTELSQTRNHLEGGMAIGRDERKSIQICLGPHVDPQIIGGLPIAAAGTS